MPLALASLSICFCKNYKSVGPNLILNPKRNVGTTGSRTGTLTVVFPSVYYEGLQDKLAQIRDARGALNALREEHREKLRRAAEEAERQRQIQLAQKLEIMRQKKQVRLVSVHAPRETHIKGGLAIPHKWLANGGA